MDATAMTNDQWLLLLEQARLRVVSYHQQLEQMREEIFTADSADPYRHPTVLGARYEAAMAAYSAARDIWQIFAEVAGYPRPDLENAL